MCGAVLDCDVIAQLHAETQSFSKPVVEPGAEIHGVQSGRTKEHRVAAGHERYELVSAVEVIRAVDRRQSGPKARRRRRAGVADLTANTKAAIKESVDADADMQCRPQALTISCDAGSEKDIAVPTVFV